VVDGVEGRQQVEADQDSDLLVVGRREDSVQNLQYCSLRVIFFLYADWNWLKLADPSRWGRRRANTNLSVTLDTVGRLEIGL